MYMYNDVEDEMTKEELDQRIKEFVEGIGVAWFLLRQLT